MEYRTYDQSMPRRIEDYRGLKQASRVRLLHAVQKIPGRKLDELAETAGIHINTAREHLHLLEEEGLIVSRPISTGTRGRPPVVFDPVQQSGLNSRADRRAHDSQSTGDLLRRLYPSPEGTPVLDTDSQHQVDTLFTHLDDVGLEPVLDEDGLGITLMPCTFHDLLLEESAAVVCSVHARLIQDHLSQVPGSLQMERLLPFVTPHECRVTLCARMNPPRANQAPSEPQDQE